LQEGIFFSKEPPAIIFTVHRISQFLKMTISTGKFISQSLKIEITKIGKTSLNIDKITDFFVDVTKVFKTRSILLDMV
jgi:hypothetical protein